MTKLNAYEYLEPNKLSTLSSKPKYCIEKSLVTNVHPAYLQMTNLCIEEMVLFRNLTKIGTDEFKAIYSIS